MSGFLTGEEEGVVVFSCMLADVPGEGVGLPSKTLGGSEN